MRGYDLECDCLRLSCLMRDLRCFVIRGICKSWITYTFYFTIMMFSYRVSFVWEMSSCHWGVNDAREHSRSGRKVAVDE